MSKIQSKIQSKVHRKVNSKCSINGNPFGTSRASRVRKAIANAVLGLFVIGVGVGYLGNEVSFLPWEDFTLFFPGWGALFLLVPGVYGLIRKPLSWFWPACILVGALIVLSKQEAYGFAKAAAIVLAAAVILVGLRIALSPLFRRARRKKMQKQWQKMAGTTDHVLFTDATGGATADGVYSVSFGERRVNIDEEFTSATISVSFGEMRFDLSRAIITDCAVIDATCSFGELRIDLPDNVQVELNPSATLAEVSNHHAVPADPEAPTVYITANCSFGEISIH